MKIVKTGPGTSIQDKGRWGFASFGVPISGVLDERSVPWVNHLLRNKETDSVLEICQPGLIVQFEAPCLICLGGAKASVKLNGKAVSSFGILQIRENDLLETGKFHDGSVHYLGIKNGFQSEIIMNSRSWFAGITNSDFAKKGEKIPYITNQELPKFTASKVKWNFGWHLEQIIEVYPGPEWDLLSPEDRKYIESTKFTVSDLKNRMAIQLVELLPNSIHEMATAPVFPGTIQLTSGGKLIILMKDAQVTGGYPRILQVSEKALSILAQKKNGEKIKFTLKAI